MDTIKDALKDKATDKAKETVKETASETAKQKLNHLGESVPQGLKTISDHARSMMSSADTGSGGGDKGGDRYRLDTKAFGWSLVAGGVAACIAKTAVAPIEMMKPTSYETSVATQQGYMTYWRGNLSNVVRAFPNEGLNFALRDYYNGMLGIRDIDARREPWKYFWTSYTGGGAAGVVSLAVLYPVDAAYGSRLPANLMGETMARELNLKGSSQDIAQKYDIGKIGKVDPVKAGRETMNMAKDAAKGVRETAKDATVNLKDTAQELGRKVKDTAQDVTHKVKETAQDMGHKVKETAQDMGHRVREGHMPVAAKPEGFLGLYRGFVPSVTGAFVYRAAYFGAYDTVRAMYPDKSTFLWTWLIAQTTTTASGILAHPFDVIRYRMMHQRDMYSNTWNCWAKTCQREGFSALYRGATSNMVRGTGGALTLVFYDMIKKYMGTHKIV